MPLYEILFKRLSEITDIETIGKVKNPKRKKSLNEKHGKARWIYKKGVAKIEDLDTGKLWIAEIHFCSAHGKGKHDERIKYLLRRFYE